MSSDERLLSLVSAEVGENEDQQTFWSKVLEFPPGDSPAFVARDYDKRLPLHVAADKKAPPEVLQFLARHTPETGGSDGECSVAVCHLMVARMWDEAAAAVGSATDEELNAEDQWHRTPLMWALCLLYTSPSPRDRG